MTEMVQGSSKPAKTDCCTVVVPCYDEEHRLPTKLFSTFLSSDPRIKFLFVNDGSRDGTLTVLQKLKAEHPACIDVLDLPANMGKAEAVRHGMLLAIDRDDAAYTGFWDADLATPLNEIPEMLSKLLAEPQIEMIFGSRVRLLGRAIERKATRHYLGRVFATVVSVTMRLPIYDTQCGAKLFRITPSLSTLLKEPFQSRWIFDVEILARYLSLHRSNPQHVYSAIYEHPLQKWIDVAGSKVRPLDFLKAFYELVRLRARYLR
jgi:dolichyl-phosphate beta-glucosyltransferase